MASGFCAELICTKCGAFWCDRGCNTDSGPDPKRVERWNKEGKPKWSGKFDTSGGVYGPESRTRCRYCGGDEVVWWH